MQGGILVRKGGGSLCVRGVLACKGGPCVQGGGVLVRKWWGVLVCKGGGALRV